MPKAQSNNAHSTSQPFQSAHVLRRNQACHQCRRRKLKCDAKRPCSTCVRSHTYAVAHAPTGAELPSQPHCTFDEVSESDNSDYYENPRSRFERLETRINELESLLRERDIALLAAQPAIEPRSLTEGHLTSASRDDSQTPPDANPSSRPNGHHHAEPYQNGVVIDPILVFQQVQSGSPLDHLAGVASLMGAPSAPSPPAQITTTSASPGQTDTSPTASIHSADSGLDLIYDSWPKNLPNPTFLRHLVDAFFTYHPDAHRLFHHSTFLTSLTFPPTHPRFPSIAVLHAICAIGSMYTAVLPRPPIPTSPSFSPYDVFPDKYKASEGIPDTFSELQAKYARTALETAMDASTSLFQNVQALTLLSWWYWSNAKWAEAFLTTSHALRYSLPCGLNVCPPFHAIAETLRPPSLLPPAKTVVEDETRRNAFWLAYAYERTHGTGNGWAMTLDDQDVAQLLPLRRDQFEHGVLVLPSERQWSHDSDVLSVTSKEQTDPFHLYIKASMLLSRVKNLNLRFRAKFHTGDPSTSMNAGATELVSNPFSEGIDPRKTQGFIELSQVIVQFKASLHSYIKNPSGEHLDPHLYAAAAAMPYAEILLHEPHAVIGESTCISSCKILTAARSILDMLYDVCSTSYDLRHLGLFPIMCWFMAGRVLVRFLRVAIDCESNELGATLRREADYIRMTLFRVGEHVPLAHRYAKMLHDFTIQTCGEMYSNISAAPVQAYAASAGNGTPFDSSRTIQVSL